MSVFVHPTAIVDEGALLGDGTKVWHFSHLMAGARLGAGCNLGQNVFVAGGVTIGRNCKVQNNVSLFKGLTCGNDVFIGPSVVFTNVKTPRAHVNRRGQYIPTRVEDGATLGAGSVIVCGVTLHAYSMVGAGAVVTRDVRPYELVYGNPARHAGWVSRTGIRLDFDDNGGGVDKN